MDAQIFGGWDGELGGLAGVEEAAHLGFASEFVWEFQGREGFGVEDGDFGGQCA